VYRVFDGGKKQILMATIPEGTQKPYYSLVKTDDITPKNWAFVRVHDQVLPASPVLINVLKRQTAGKNTLIKYTDFERNILVFLENNAHITLKKMAEINNIPLWKAAQIASNLVCAGVVSIAPTATDDVFALVVV
jgi:predicted peptidase